jgi:DNA-binding NarL/FixJ family response regulator
LEETRRIRVLLADDHDIVRRGLYRILETDRSVEVVGEARDGAEAVTLAKALQPDVIVMDIKMPKMDGISATREIKRELPSCAVLIFSMIAEDSFEEAIEAGISGYILKDGDSAKVLEAIHQIRRGINPLSLALNKKLMTEYYRIGSETAHSLTPRQVRVLKLISEGVGSEGICTSLKISFSTEKRELRAIYDLLGVSTRAQAVAVAIKQGILSKPSSP